MKKGNLFIVALCVIFCMSACEKADIDFDSDVEIRLTSLLGEEIEPVSNTLKSKGFTRMGIEQLSSFVNPNETYNFASNKKKPKTIYSAGYQLTDLSESAGKTYGSYRNSLLLKQGTEYEAQIAASPFVDLTESYVDSVRLSNNMYAYIYDDPLKFKSVYDMNYTGLVMASESWWKGERYKDKMWTIELLPGTNKRSQVGFICSDYTLYVK